MTFTAKELGFKFEIGDIVRYHPIIGGTHDGRLYTIRRAATLSPNRPVYWLANRAGCVAESSLSLWGREGEE